MSRSSKIELLYFCVLIESLAGYAYDEKHNGRHTDGKHDDLYPHGTKHAKHDKDATFAYQIVETDRTFTYDAAGKLVSATETEDNYGTYIYTYEYDLMGNRTYMEKTLNGTVAEWHKYEYNESNQLVSEQLYNGKKTTSLATPMMRTATALRKPVKSAPTRWRRPMSTPWRTAWRQCMTGMNCSLLRLMTVTATGYSY